MNPPMHRIAKFVKLRCKYFNLSHLLYALGVVNILLDALHFVHMWQNKCFYFSYKRDHLVDCERVALLMLRVPLQLRLHSGLS